MENKGRFYWQDQALIKYNLSMSQIIDDMASGLDQNKNKNTVINNILLFLKNDIPSHQVKSTISDMCVPVDFLLEKWNKVSVVKDLISSKVIKKQGLEKIINDYSDNFVAYRDGDDFGKLLFDIAVSKGCCGSSDFEVFVKDENNHVVKWFIHFNFGH